MAATIKQLGITVSIVTVIGAFATAPAQAALFASVSNGTSINDVVSTGEPTSDQALKPELLAQVETAIDATSTSESTSRETDDTTPSYTYTYKSTYYLPEPMVKKEVPEPSALLGLMAVVGVFASRRQLQKKPKIG